MDSPAIPTQIGRYRILSELGRGSMGRVYLALDPNIDRQVALKVVSASRDLEAGEQKEFEKRFLLEARAAGKLNHPGIVMIFDSNIEESSGAPYLVMELVEGRSLAAMLKSGHPLAMRVAVAIVARVARALDYSHRRGIVHRDIKPANVLVANDGKVKILDFGIAKVASESHTAVGMIVGSPNYMSPEQIENLPIDGRSDLFSLGIVLYACVTGALPFHGESIGSTTYKIVHLDPTPPEDYNPLVPEPLRLVLARALQKRPENRYQSGLEFAHALEALDLSGADDGIAATGASAGASKIFLDDITPDMEVPSTGPIVPPLTAVSPSSLEPNGSPHASSSQAPTQRQESSPPREASLSWGSFSLRRDLRRWMLLPILLLLLVIYGVFVSRSSPGKRSPTERSVAGPAAAPARDGSAKPAASATPATPAAPNWAIEETAAPESRLEVMHANRLALGSIQVFVDGKKVWSRKLIGSKNVFKKISGTDIRGSIPVSAGAHDIEVRIDGQSMDVHARDVIHAVFAKGQTRRLRVDVNPYTDDLDLEWE